MKYAPSRQSLPETALRLGVGFPFLYAGLAGLGEPVSWIGFLPAFLQSEAVLAVFSIGEIVLALWLFWGVWPRASSAVAIAILLGIIGFNAGAADIIFRDVGVLFAAIALFTLSSLKHHEQ